MGVGWAVGTGPDPFDPHPAQSASPSAPAMIEPRAAMDRLRKKVGNPWPTLQASARQHRRVNDVFIVRADPSGRRIALPFATDLCGAQTRSGACVMALPSSSRPTYPCVVTLTARA